MKLIVALLSAGCGLSAAQKKACTDSVVALAFLKQQAAACSSLSVGILSQAACEAKATDCTKKTTKVRRRCRGLQSSRPKGKMTVNVAGLSNL